MLFKRGMSDRDIALAAIDAQIETRDKKIAKLRPALNALEQEREALVQSRAILAAVSPNGHHKAAPIATPIVSAAPSPITADVATAVAAKRPNPFSSPSPILAAVDEIIGDGELHIDGIMKGLEARGFNTSKAVLTTSLARRAAKKKRYRRVEGKPNTFALLKGGDQEAKE